MVDLDPNKVKAALMRGLAPLDQHLTDLKNESVITAWEAFLRGTTKQLLMGDITVDEWKTELANFAREVAKVSQKIEGDVIMADAEQAAAVVEEAFAPPSKMRWLIFGGIAASAIAYWWLKKEERQNQRLLVATPEI